MFPLHSLMTFEEDQRENNLFCFVSFFISSLQRGNKWLLISLSLGLLQTQGRPLFVPLLLTFPLRSSCCMSCSLLPMPMKAQSCDPCSDSPARCISSRWRRHPSEYRYTQGGGQKKRFSLPYDFCATLACSITTTLSGRSCRYLRIASGFRRWSLVGRNWFTLERKEG